MLKSSVEFRIGGRRVSSNDFKKHLGDEVLRLSRNQVEQAVRRIRCPVHGTPAHIQFARGTSDQLEWSVKGCCQDLANKIQTTLGGNPQ